MDSAVRDQSILINFGGRDHMYPYFSEKHEHLVNIQQQVKETSQPALARWRELWSYSFESRQRSTHATLDLSPPPKHFYLVYKIHSLQQFHFLSILSSHTHIPLLHTAFHILHKHGRLSSTSTATTTGISLPHYHGSHGPSARH
jgi:hypothetical protein